MANQDIKYLCKTCGSPRLFFVATKMTSPNDGPVDSPENRDEANEEMKKEVGKLLYCRDCKVVRFTATCHSIILAKDACKYFN